MSKPPPKWVVSTTETQPKALIVGQRDPLLIQVLKALEKKGCQVFIRESLITNLPKVNYVFQLGSLAETKKILAKAFTDKARYLLVVEKTATDQSKKAIRGTLAFKEKIDCRILRIEEVASFNTPVIANQILKAMFGKKRPLPALLKPERKMKNRFRFTIAKFKTSFYVLTLLTIFLLFSSPYLFFGVNLYWGIKNLRSFEANFLNGDLKGSQENVVLAKTYFSRTKKVSRYLPLLRKGGRLAFFGETLSQTAASTVELYKIGQRLARLVLEEDKGALQERLNQFKVEVESLEKQLSLTVALFADLNLKDYQDIKFLGLGEGIKSISKRLFSAEELALFLRKAMPLADEFLGITKDKVYLVLFQNNMELRPGGGFIGSYGLASFQRGVFTEFESFDVYTADGQLKGHVDPPIPIRKYLEQPHFFLRDSNFSPDFAVNAGKAAWFLKKEIRQEVDGVIAIDLSFVQKILEALGGIYLPDYKQTITSENLFLKAQALIQPGFFPGSTQKKDFLGSLAQVIFNQARVAEFPWFKIAIVLKEAFEEKHCQIYLFSEEAQKLVDGLGWGGRMGSAKCKVQTFVPSSGRGSAKCFGDYLMIVEANLGVNKANFFVEREISLKTKFSQKKINHNFSISYQNSSSAKTFPGGAYKNYLRVFVPEESVLEWVEFKGKEIPIGQIETENEEDKKSWGILLEILPGETAKATFQYTLSSQDLLNAKQFSYEIFIQKQAGTEKDPLFLNFEFPTAWQIEKTNFSASRKGGLKYSSNLSVDRVFSIDFLKINE